MRVEVGVRGQAVDERAARLLRRSGEPLNATIPIAERESDGRRLLVCDVSLAFLASGDYLLEVAARNGTAADRKLVAFRVR
jgi:hypothetical protein